MSDTREPDETPRTIPPPPSADAPAPGAAPGSIFAPPPEPVEEVEDTVVVTPAEPQDDDVEDTLEVVPAAAVEEVEDTVVVDHPAVEEEVEDTVVVDSPVAEEVEDTVVVDSPVAAEPVAAEVPEPVIEVAPVEAVAEPTPVPEPMVEPAPEPEVAVPAPAPAPPPVKKSRALVFVIVGVIVAALAALAVVLLIVFQPMSGTPQASETPSDEATTDAPTPTPTPTPTPSEPVNGGPVEQVDDDGSLGSFSNPGPPGSVVTFTDFAGANQWQVAVTAGAQDATAQVAQASAANPAPAAGNVYVLVPISYTYLGAGTGYPALGVTPTLISQDRSYIVADVEFPDALPDAAAVANGATVNTNAVFEVPASAVSGSIVRLTSAWHAHAHVSVG
ncbi:hypothetical protein [Protaetiibacter intestinalis]|uniref:hypothetical protein n=1 Tax=Protaetiibacter intestinalis TaxID=2419774 RepID=UPI001300AB26|nr:hypothetical protein [Protaetiibacter intestinalis]